MKKSFNDGVRLRGHHFLCVLTHIGKGYTPDFTSNMGRVVNALHHGARIEIVRGSDDICGPIANDPKAHCHDSDIPLRDVRALIAVHQVLRRPMRPGIHLHLTPHDWDQLRAAFVMGTPVPKDHKGIKYAFRAACQGCAWQNLCNDIAGKGFKDTILLNGLPAQTAPAPIKQKRTWWLGRG